jgi:hypothetical protein
MAPAIFTTNLFDQGYQIVDRNRKQHSDMFPTKVSDNFFDHNCQVSMYLCPEALHA